ncbi:MAG TPA: hypothetical protein DCY88_21245 [Cyanobacteria bacterium UBA11372]|nr:hypothetical protein [Cyanobacteria bacterium UBA11372]
MNDSFEKSLKTHKLSGKLKEFWSFSIEYDERILFYFTDDGKAVFVDIGSHDEVYEDSSLTVWADYSQK